MRFDGKRLLFVGGALFQLPGLKRARDLGCHVVLVDMNPDVPGRELASVFEQVSTSDIPAVLAVAQKHKVDAIMTYASDSSVPTVAAVAEKLGLPGNPPAAADTIRRKDLWREFQKANGLPHPDFFVASTASEALDRIDSLTFPVVVKPVDSAGTKGQTVIYGKREVPLALDVALGASILKRVVFENFIHADRMELDGDVFFQGGKLAFRHYGHNYFLKNRISNVPSGERFPGAFDDAFTKHIDEQFETTISKLGLRAGNMNFDALAVGDTVYIVDVGLRCGGNYVPDLIQLSTGVDMSEGAVHAAFGVEYPLASRSVASPKAVASYLVGSRYGGRFDGIEFSDEIKRFVVETRPFAQEGTIIRPYTRADYAVGITFFEFPDVATMNAKMDEIEDLVKVKVTPVRGSAKSAEKARPTRGTSLAENADFKEFPELISPFLRQKLAEAEANNDRTVLRVISRQYIETDDERNLLANEGLKHYEAGEVVMWEGQRLYGVERLYRRVILFEPLYQCVANCRYCLRRNYEPFNQTREDIHRIARYVGSAPGHEDLREVLVTGGDPFLAPQKTGEFLDALAEHAPQIKIARVATRIPIQQPDRVNDKLLAMLGKKYPFRIEVATQINHASELFPEVRDAYTRIRETVGTIYNQTVLLKGVNDSLDELVDLCDGLRELGIENHYLFHCVPIGGLNSLRTTLRRGIELAREISASGRISGRAKPQFLLMTDIGKITPYEGMILEHKDNKYLLRSNYSYADRLKFNPSWQLPKTGVVGPDGKLCVWYTDASEDAAQAPAVTPARGAGSSELLSIASLVR
jgi:lysine 2,3-aminomutase